MKLGKQFSFELTQAPATNNNNNKKAGLKTVEGFKNSENFKVQSKTTGILMISILLDIYISESSRMRR